MTEILLTLNRNDQKPWIKRDIKLDELIKKYLLNKLKQASMKLDLCKLKLKW
jgi:hypothetical protein